jgi:polyphosphate kinase
VLAIKQTLYRTSPDSPILEALIRAAGRGKQVSVVVELTARFDEANNIEWARKLEDAGVHIAYGSPSLKVHSKISLVVREEADGTRLYGHIGTGNYNSRTARVYSDLGLFTSDPGIGRDLIAIFNYLTGFSERLRTATLITSPSGLRGAFEARVRREIGAARAGRRARIIFKMNALEDARFTALLYEAAQAGVQVDLVIRGVCRLRPGVPGLSEGVRVVSVVGRFLEHARIYYFENDGDPECFIGSADLMKRNLDERIETIAPVRQPELGARLLAILEAQLGDRRQGWELVDREWHRDASAEGPGVHAMLVAQRGRPLVERDSMAR